MLSKIADANPLKFSILIFNALGVMLAIAFLPWIARALERLIPDGKNQNRQTERVKG